jgi:outer membrane receptor protein involved in Fe transport
MAKMKRNPLSFAVRAALAPVVSLTALGAQAQAPAGVIVEEVVVTGSRIARRDFTSNAPVTSVDRQQLVLTNTVNTETLLNSLPQTVPGFDRTSNNPGDGTATVDLRGLGANRTLVLIDGKRVTPTRRDGVVDINSIPTALIENVEVLTGGASAVYGADAVAGVVNFILRDDFEGVDLNFSTQQTEKGDAGLTTIDLTVGGNFGGDRGNAVLNVQWTDREDLFQGDRGFSNVAQFDTPDLTGLEPGGSSGIPQTSIITSALADAFGTTAILFNQDGTARPYNGNEDNYNYAPVNYLQLPQERYQATGLASFELNDQIEAYARVMYTSSTVPQQLAPTPIFTAAEFTLDGSPFLDPGVQQQLSDAVGAVDADGNLIDSDGDGIADTAVFPGSFDIRRRLEEVGPRFAESKYTAFNFQLGLRGDINDSWGYDAYYQRGQVDQAETQLGNVSRERFAQALLLDLDADPTGGTCANPSSSGATLACAPINIFGEGNISDAGAAFLRTAVTSNAQFVQEVAGVTITGDLFELPGGMMSTAFGVEWIDNSFDFVPSQDLASGNIAGFNAAPPVAGSFSEQSVFGELYLPVLSDAPLAEMLDVTLAYRYSDFSTVGGVSNYKADFSWAPISDVRLRGSISTATRAPNIGELFAPQAVGAPSGQDPCSALGNPTPDVAAICVATGVPADQVGSPALNVPAGQVQALSGGNPDLQEESADTYTLGVVFTPSMIEGLSMSVDYFNIEIEDFITPFGGGASNVLQTCYDPTNPQGGAGSDFCNVVRRGPTGFLDRVDTLSQNVAVQTLVGFDLLADYSFDALGGNFRLQYVGTYTTESDFVAFSGDSPLECNGRFGNNCGEPLPEYTHRFAVTYGLDNLTGQLVWRYVGEVDDDTDAKDFTVETIDAESYIDGSVQYALNGGLSLQAGVQNLFDVDPPVIGANAEQANTYPATYDVFGRTYFVRVGYAF